MLQHENQPAEGLEAQELENAQTRLKAAWSRIKEMPLSERGESIELVMTMQDKLREARSNYVSAPDNAAHHLSHQAKEGSSQLITSMQDKLKEARMRCANAMSMAKRGGTFQS